MAHAWSMRTWGSYVGFVGLALLLAAGRAVAQTPTDESAAPTTTAAEATSDPSAAAPQNQRPQPADTAEETNWASLLKDTARDFISFPKRPSTWVLLGAGGVAALAVHPADNYVESHIVGNDAAERFFATGKVIGSTAFHLGSAMTLYVVGRQLTKGENRTHPLTHLGFDLLRSQIVSQAIVHGIKYTAQRDRPTGECCAFPSGHATSAFAAASVLERHFGYRGSWPALVAASYVATSRLVDNRHYLSDVVFGAALGTSVGWTVVGRHRTSKFALQPVPIRGGMMVAFVRTAD
jgi:membrane-associated phospholipid phosphatase